MQESDDHDDDFYEQDPTADIAVPEAQTSGFPSSSTSKNPVLRPSSKSAGKRRM